MRSLAILLFSLQLNAFADRLVLNNGKEYLGTFLDGERGQIKFRTGRNTVRTFRAADIVRLEIGPERPATPTKSSTPPDEADCRRGATSGATVESVELRQTPVAQEPDTTPPSPGASAGAAAPMSGDSATIPGAAALDSEYTRLGDTTGALGAARGPNQYTMDRRASVRFFNLGAIYWTPNAGAHAISGPILDTWLSQGGERSRLGYPTSDEEVTEAGFSRRQRFEGGEITWTQRTGAAIAYARP
jgi:uncharacterized protein with LGFP repeats